MVNYLSQKKDPNIKSSSFLRYFKNLPGQMVITNYRVLFVPKLEEMNYRT